MNFAIASIGFEGLALVFEPYKDTALIAFFITIFSGDGFGTSMLSDLRFYIVNLVLILFIILGSIIGNEPFYTQLAKEYARK